MKITLPEFEFDDLCVRFEKNSGTYYYRFFNFNNGLIEMVFYYDSGRYTTVKI